jgi:hypothetical protein
VGAESISRGQNESDTLYLQPYLLLHLLLQPWGLKAYLEDKISQTHDAEEKLNHSITMAEERIMREKVCH